MAASITLGFREIRDVIILSLDTTTRAGSAAVLRGASVLAEIAGDGSRTHGERLPADLVRVLELAAVRLTDVERFAVAAGPGSFTGLRIGIATVQGLAMASGRLVVPVSTLEALARAGASEGRPVGAWMDAQRGEVFAALYAPDGGGVLVAPVSARPAAVLDAWSSALEGREAVLVGDGAVRYAGAIQASLGAGASVVAPPPLAGIIGRIAADHPDRAVLPHAVIPIYIRKPDAELARDRRGIGGRGV